MDMVMAWPSTVQFPCGICVFGSILFYAFCFTFSFFFFIILFKINGMRKILGISINLHVDFCVQKFFALPNL